MKKITSIVALLLVLVLAACVLSSCGKKEDSTIKVYTNPEYPPFEYMEGEVATGYDIDMIKAIAEKAGFEVEIIPTHIVEGDPSNIKITYPQDINKLNTSL